MDVEYAALCFFIRKREFNLAINATCKIKTMVDCTPYLTPLVLCVHNGEHGPSNNFLTVQVCIKKQCWPKERYHSKCFVVEIRVFCQFELHGVS